MLDALAAAEGAGRFFANRPAVYWLSLAGSGGASTYALMRVRRPRGGARLPWAAMAVLETAITIGMIRARNSAKAGGGSGAESGVNHAPAGDGSRGAYGSRSEAPG